MDTSGEVTKRECEAVTSQSLLLDQSLFCKAAVCVLLVPKMCCEDFVILVQELASTFEVQRLCCQVDRTLDRSLRIVCLSSAYTLSHCVIFGKLFRLFPPTGNRGSCFTLRSVRDSIIYSDCTVLCQSLGNHC